MPHHIQRRMSRPGRLPVKAQFMLQCNTVPASPVIKECEGGGIPLPATAFGCVCGGP